MNLDELRNDPVANINNIAMTYAREATKIKNDLVFSRTEWEKKDHHIRLSAYRSLLDPVIKQITDFNVKNIIKEIIRYLDAGDDLDIKAKMHRANELIKNV